MAPDPARLAVTVVRIDPAEHELQRDAAAAALGEAEARVEVEKALAEESAAAFARENPGADIPERVRRTLQIAQAEAALMRARAELGLAQLRLERTEISLPYDSRVAAADTRRWQPRFRPPLNSWSLSMRRRRRDVGARPLRARSLPASKSYVGQHNSLTQPTRPCHRRKPGAACQSGGRAPPLSRLDGGKGGFHSASERFPGFWTGQGRDSRDARSGAHG